MLAYSLVAVSGLRVSSKALGDLTQKNGFSGSVRSEAQDLANLLRTTLKRPIVPAQRRPPRAPRPAAPDNRLRPRRPRKPAPARSAASIDPRGPALAGPFPQPLESTWPRKKACRNACKKCARRACR